MSNTSVALRFLMLLLVVLGLLGGAAFLVLDKIYRTQLHDKANVVADSVEEI